jgi:response regulator NasT
VSASVQATSVAAPLRVLVAAADEEVRALLSYAITSAGHAVVAQAATAAEAITRSLALTPDVALIDVELPDASGAEAAALVARADAPIGLVLVGADPNAALSDAEVEATGTAALLPSSTPRALLDATLRCAAARARELAAARAATAAARRQLAERKLIERAKGILMRRTGSTEAEAYRILERSSRDRGAPVTALARAVLDSEPGAAGRA